MGVLSDVEIRKLCLPPNPKFSPIPPMIEPFSEGVSEGGVISFGLTSAGYDLRMGHKFLIFKNTFNEMMDPKRLKKDGELFRKVFDELTGVPDGHQVVIPAHCYILAYSLEYIRMPRHLVGTVVGKSTYARCGIIVNTTPLEPAWEGHLTIEIGNISPSPVCVYAGEGIGQLRFDTIEGEVGMDYKQKVPGGGKYQNQGPEPIPARIID